MGGFYRQKEGGTKMLTDFSGKVTLPQGKVGGFILLFYPTSEADYLTSADQEIPV